MEQSKSNHQTFRQLVFKLIDPKQFEVRFAFGLSIFCSLFLFLIAFHKNFSSFHSSLPDLILAVISGLISLIGIAVAGITIVITLFNVQQIKLINSLKECSFDLLLYDFKWFAMVATFEVAIFMLLFFGVQLPLPLVPAIFLYLICFCLFYLILYLLFYACALIGNCISLSRLKLTLDKISSEEKSIAVIANECKIDFLISKLLKQNAVAANDFYDELLSIIESSDRPQKDDIASYLRKNCKQ